MQPILAFIIIALAVATFSFFGQPQEQKGETMSQPEKTVSQAQVSAPIRSVSTPVETKPNVLVNTYIISGPEEGEVINETNKVTFEFGAEILPEETKGRISFETKVEGFDEDWKRTYSQKRTITLPPGPKEYTFLVRAKINDLVDPTPAKRTFQINVSPYFGKVEISSVQTPTLSRPSLITLRTRLQKEEEINIAGWEIEGKRGDLTIPQGIEKYNPFYNAPENIIIKQGDVIYLSSAPNPLGKNNNFRPNKCLGYLASYDFIIGIPKNCPKPSQEEISHLEPCCQEFILRLSRCEIPDYSDSPVIYRDSECVAYLNENFNYGGCYLNYSKDEDFVGKNWHIYLNRDIIVSSNCNTLYLLDQNGLFIDKYSYGRPICK